MTTLKSFAGKAALNTSWAVFFFLIFSGSQASAVGGFGDSGSNPRIKAAVEDPSSLPTINTNITPEITNAPARYLQWEHQLVNGQFYFDITGRKLNGPKIIIGYFSTVSNPNNRNYFSYNDFVQIDSNTLRIFFRPAAENMYVHYSIAKIDRRGNIIAVSNQVTTDILRKPRISSVPANFDLNQETANGNGEYSIPVTGFNFDNPVRIVGQMTYNSNPENIINVFTDNITYGDSHTLWINFQPNESATVRYSVVNLGPNGEELGISPQVTTNIIGLNSNSGGLNEGDVACVLETTTPSSQEFVIHGTCPVPRGTDFLTNEIVPFKVKDINGSLSDTQVDVITRYPDGSASNVEISALVHRTSNASGQLQYQVIYSPHGAEMDVTNTNTIPFLKNVKDINSNIKNELLTAGALKVHTTDIHDNTYSLDLLSGYSKVMRGDKNGDIRRTVRTYDVLTKDNPNANNTLPHMHGVYAYVTTTDRSDVLHVDLKVLNAANGLDNTTNKDDAFDELFFKNFQISIPEGWSLVAEVNDPFFNPNPVSTSNGRKTYDLVKAIDAIKVHAMFRHSQFDRRLALVRDSDVTKAQAALALEGLAFNKDSRDLSGNQRWSWWNKDTATYFPQNSPLPNWNYLGVNGIRTNGTYHYSNLKQRIETGTCYSTWNPNTNQWECNYPIQNNVMGWSHPYGVNYGGMTSGNEIFVVDAPQYVYAGSIDAMRMHLLLMRMYDSRERYFLVNKDGSFDDISQHLFNGCGNKGQNVEYNQAHYQPDTSKGNPWGFGNAAYNQFNYVNDNGKLPSYYYSIKGYTPWDGVDNIDGQHLIRITRSQKVAIYVMNDPIAKDNLDMLSRNLEIVFTKYPKIGSCGPIWGSMLAATTWTNDHPNLVTASLGREHAWMTDAMSAAYSIGDDSYRNSKKYWSEGMIDLANSVQTCTGNWQALINEPKTGMPYPANQLIENIFMANGIQGSLKQVFDGVDQDRMDKINHMLSVNYHGLIDINSRWSPAHHEPAKFIAVASIDFSEEYCPDTHVWTADQLHFECGSCELGTSLARGFWTSGDPLFLNRLQETYWGASLLQGSQNKFYHNPENSNSHYTDALRAAQEQAGQYP